MHLLLCKSRINSLVLPLKETTGTQSTKFKNLDARGSARYNSRMTSFGTANKTIYC
jgi:hypothetical protein